MGIFGTYNRNWSSLRYGRDRNDLAKGVPYLPSGLYETRMFHSSPQGGVHGVS